MAEVPIIRCMGLNYRDHAKEANMAIPDTPVLFVKPRTALNGPWPAKINVPKVAQDGTSDYEAELSIVISKTGRDIAKEDAMDYVLGYTSSNDVSARAQQFKNSQWSFSKGTARRNCNKHSGSAANETRLGWIMSDWSGSRVAGRHSRSAQAQDNSDL